MKELIKQYFQGCSKIKIANTFLKFIKSNPEVEKYLNNILIENPNWENIRNIVYSICFDEQLKKCKNCRKEMKYSQGLKHDYCSHKCSASSTEVRKKTKQTCLETYGCLNPFQNKEIQEKIKQTCLEKYGCEYISQIEKIKDKIKQTNLEKIGCEYPAQNKEVQKKYKQTCLEKYNCENPMQSKEVQEKIKCTNKERFNVNYFVQSEEFKRSHYDNSFDNFILSFIQYGITPLFLKEEYIGWDKTYRWRCLVCQNEFEQKIHTTGHIKECPYLPHCWKCYPRMSGESRFELELFDFVKQLFPNAHQHDRTIIKPYELDIVIDELKLAIEFNGDYWHSVEFYLEHHDNLDEYYNYHLNKVLETNKKGYRLIHIWENELDEIEDKLKDILEGKEDLNFTEDIIKLDRSWYNNVEIPGYKLIEELPPEMINRNGYNVENCGYLVYIKNI